MGRFGGEARQEGALGLEGVGPRDEERGEAGSSLGRLDRPREGMRSTRLMQRKQGIVLCSTGSRSRAAASGISGAVAKDGGRGTGREGGTDLTGGEVLRAWGGGKPAATDLEIPGGAPVFPAKERNFWIGGSGIWNEEEGERWLGGEGSGGDPERVLVGWRRREWKDGTGA